MSAAPPLPLRDVHVLAAPPWWPPAPGWWWLAAAVALAAVGAAWLCRRRARRRAAIMAVFDGAVDAATSPVGQLAAMSDVLRRAARRRDPSADRMEGDAWLAFLDDGMSQPVFTSGPGALLRDGAFRAQVDAAAVRATRDVARERYRRWMLGR